MANKDIHNNVGNRVLLYSFLIIFVVFMFAINVLLWSICEKYKLANEQQQKIILEYVVQQAQKH